MCVRMRWLGLLLTLTLQLPSSTAQVQAPSAPSSAPKTSLFSSYAPLDLQLKAPLNDLFTKSASNDAYAVTGTLSYRDPDSGQSVVVNDVRVTVRGHTSKQETECDFPKLKLTFPQGSRSGA